MPHPYFKIVVIYIMGNHCANYGHPPSMKETQFQEYLTFIFDFNYYLHYDYPPSKIKEEFRVQVQKYFTLTFVPKVISLFQESCCYLHTIGNYCAN